MLRCWFHWNFITFPLKYSNCSETPHWVIPQYKEQGGKVGMCKSANKGIKGHWKLTQTRLRCQKWASLWRYVKELFSVWTGVFWRKLYYSSGGCLDIHDSNYLCWTSQATSIRPCKTKGMVSNQMRSHHKSTNYVLTSVLLFCISATIPNRKSEGTVSNLEQ